MSHFRNRASTVRQRLEETPSPQEDSVLSEELAVFNTELEIGLNKISTGESSADCHDSKGLIEKLLE